MVSGIGSAGTRTSQVLRSQGGNKNMDIEAGESSPGNDYVYVDPALLETSSPSNRRVMEDAYRTYTSNSNYRGPNP